MLQDRRRDKADQLFAGGAIIVMGVLTAISVYAAGETHRVLNAIARAESAT